MSIQFQITIALMKMGIWVAHSYENERCFTLAFVFYLKQHDFFDRRI